MSSLSEFESESDGGVSTGSEPSGSDDGGTYSSGSEIRSSGLKSKSNIHLDLDAKLLCVASGASSRRQETAAEASLLLDVTADADAGAGADVRSSVESCKAYADAGATVSPARVIESADNDGNDDVDDDALPPVRVCWGLFPNYVEPTVFFPYPERLDVPPREEPPNGLSDLSLRKGAIPRPTYKLHWERNACKDSLRAAGFARTKSLSQWNLYWGKHIKRDKILRGLNTYQRSNHFPGSWLLGRKDRVQRLFERMRRRHRARFDFFPEGFVLPKQRDQLVRRLKETDQRLFIRKPLASSQGRGIKVVDRSSVLKVADKKKCVIQMYIERPLLINGKKFDIRVYILVTSFAPLRAYMFREGLARFCTAKYSRSQSSSSTKNRYGHLTNYSINKKGDNFDASEDDASGSKWSLSALLSYLSDRGHDVGSLLQRMRDVAAKTLIAGASEINYATAQKVKHREACFEVFGFDFLLDRKLKVWLLEVNVAPSLMGSSSMDSFIKGMLMCDVFHTVGVVPFNPKKASKDTAKAESDRLHGKSSAHARMRERRTRNVGAVKWRELVKADRKVVYNSINEHMRCGHFDRVFPPRDPARHEALFKLFESPTYEDALLLKFERAVMDDAGFPLPRVAQFTPETWGILSGNNRRRFEPSSVIDGKAGMRLAAQNGRVSSELPAEQQQKKEEEQVASTSGRSGDVATLVSGLSIAPKETKAAPRKVPTKKKRATPKKRRARKTKEAKWSARRGKRIYSAGAGFRRARDTSAASAKPISHPRRANSAHRGLISAIRYGKSQRRSDATSVASYSSAASVASASSNAEKRSSTRVRQRLAVLEARLNRQTSPRGLAAAPAGSSARRLERYLHQQQRGAKY